MEWLKARATETSSWLGVGLLSFMAMPLVSTPIDVILWWVVIACGVGAVVISDKK